MLLLISMMILEKLTDWLMVDIKAKNVEALIKSEIIKFSRIQWAPQSDSLHIKNH